MAESGELILLGVAHHEGDYKVERNNYKTVKEFLERTKPGFVTAEVRLHNEPAIDFLGKDLFTTDLPKLQQIDHFFMQQPLYAGEYAAAIIYCRTNNIPLYFVDFYDSSPEEVAMANITEVSKVTPEMIWYQSRDISEDLEDRIWNFEERNAFMAKVINILSEKYPDTIGVHVGGMAHFDPAQSKTTLQELIISPRVKVINATEKFELSY